MISPVPGQVASSAQSRVVRTVAAHSSHIKVAVGCLSSSNISTKAKDKLTTQSCGVAIIQAVDWSIDERLIQSTSGTVQDLLYFDVLTGLRMPPPHVAKGCTKSAPTRLAVGCPNVISFTSIYHRLLSYV